MHEKGIVRDFVRWLGKTAREVVSFPNAYAGSPKTTLADTSFCLVALGGPPGIDERSAIRRCIDHKVAPVSVHLARFYGNRGIAIV